MAYKNPTLFDIPGLNKALKLEDFKESRNIYNTLLNDSQQPEVLESYIHNLAALFVRNRADGIFGIHLAHAHFAIPVNTALLGSNYDEPYCRWARPITTRAINLSNIHGYIFVLTSRGFHPYEYQAGSIPDMSEVSNTFLPELAEYLFRNDLSTLVGLQIIDRNPMYMLELILPLATIMLDASKINKCTFNRQTGWKFEVEDGEPRVCKSNKTHGRHVGGHDIYNEGTPHPRLKTIRDVRNALIDVGILFQ